MADFKNILQADHYVIDFQQSGVATGFWIVWQRIKDDFTVKLNKGTESSGYKDKIMEMNSLVVLHEFLISKNVALDALICQYQAALVMQYMANHIIKEFRVEINSADHTPEREIVPTEEDLKDLEKKGKVIVNKPVLVDAPTNLVRGL